MREYEKPMVQINEGLAESIYLASGTGEPVADSNGVKCDSAYMKGVWQAPNYSSPKEAGYKAKFGCMGCPAFRQNACGLQTDYVESGYSDSYKADNGKRKPDWEKEGHGPKDQTDW